MKQEINDILQDDKETKEGIDPDIIKSAFIAAVVVTIIVTLFTILVDSNVESEVSEGQYRIMDSRLERHCPELQPTVNKMLEDSKIIGTEYYEFVRLCNQQKKRNLAEGLRK